MIDISRFHQIAILIDADNIKSNYVQIFELAEYYGKRSICRAYGHESSLSALREVSETFNIEVIPVNKTKKTNAADHRLLVDAGEILGNYSNNITLFIIVSGDGDFAPLCDRIRDRDSQVIVISNKHKTSKDLEASSDEFYYLEDLGKKLGELKTNYPIPKYKQAQVFLPLFFAYQQLTDNNDWISDEALEKQLQRRIVDYKCIFGEYKLSEWLQCLSEEFEYNEQERMVRKIVPPLEQQRYNFIMYVYDQIKDPNGLASLTQLGRELHQSHYYKQLLGTKKLSRWIKEYPDELRIEGDYVIHRDYWK